MGLASQYNYSSLAWYFMEQWLNNFPYRIQMSVWFLVIAAIISLTIAILTISGLTWRASKLNPVEALKAQ
jgi:putative ABC transport system permease protein